MPPRIRSIAIVLTLCLGMLLGAYPDALGLVGLSISPGEDPNFSDQTTLVERYKGYEIWKDPARSGMGEYIIYTPPGVVPAVSSIKYELAAAKRTIDSKLDAYNNPPPTSDPDLIKYTVTFIAGLGGSIEPSGSVAYVEDTQVWVKATPDSGYVFDRMTRDGELYSIQDTRICGVTGSFTVTAHFTPVETFDPSPPDDPVDDVEDQVNQMAEGIPRIYVRGSGLALLAVAFVKGKEDLLSLKTLLS